MTILAIIIGSIMGYIFIAGALRGPFLARQLSMCQKCTDGYCTEDWKDEHGRRGVTKKKSRDIHVGDATAMAMFWPFTAPFSMGVIISDRDNRDVHKRNREMAAAQHQVELAKLRRQENEEITKQLQDR